MIYWVLWFIISLPQGNLMHLPVDGFFDTEALCEEAGKPFLAMLTTQFPDDVSVRVYCEPFIPPESL